MPSGRLSDGLAKPAVAIPRDRIDALRPGTGRRLLIRSAIVSPRGPATSNDSFAIPCGHFLPHEQVGRRFACSPPQLDFLPRPLR